ncbi:MAG: hypothetical protein J6H20_04790, partial [Pyramidobacter sp.]|nr:hypothetical protein [Pyramidobacter sp.]
KSLEKAWNLGRKSYQNTTNNFIMDYVLNNCLTENHQKLYMPDQINLAPLRLTIKRAPRKQLSARQFLYLLIFGPSWRL